MKMRSKFSIGSALLQGCMFFAAASTCVAEQLQPPRHQVVDKFGVNMATGQVTASLDTVSIGGAMGLSHSFSAHTNDFNIQGLEGFIDKFAGKIRYVSLGTSAIETGGLQDRPFFVMRASDPSGTQDFRVLVNGEVRNGAGDSPSSSISYESLGDERHSLVAEGNYLVWTKPDGTRVRYRVTTGPQTTSNLADITYPNGFKITVTSDVSSVTTNTGFQLKYVYIDDHRPLDADKQGKSESASIPNADSLGWSRINPKYVVALNNSEQFCSPSQTHNCGFEKAEARAQWPTVEFQWPAGMPRAVFIGDSQFNVVLPSGGTTTYYFKAFDLALLQNGSVAESQQRGKRFSPRLVGVKPAGSDRVSLSYTYKNVFNWDSSPFSLGAWAELSTDVGQLIGASGLMGSNTYNHSSDDFGLQKITANESGGIITVSAPSSSMPTTIYSITSLDGSISFQSNYRNFPSKFMPLDGPEERYVYERGNLVEKIFNRGSSTETRITAGYPTSCNESNFKYCNSAEWIADAKGNKTFYTYHPQSGQIASITYPPDGNGVKPQTRFQYQEMYAYIKNAAGDLVQADSPIWLKTRESYCIDSNYVNGACAGNDEVVKTFEYEHNNLLMTGMTITANGNTLRTCYQYDRYGNQIGEVRPKAGLTRCEQ